MSNHFLISFLNHCCEIKNLKGIKQLHTRLITTGLLSKSQNLLAKLTQSYATVAGGEYEFRFLPFLFNSMDPSNPIPFNVIASEFSRKGQPLLALKTFAFMHGNGVPLDSYALCSLVKASSFVDGIRFGEQVHGLVMRSGWLCSLFLGSALVDFYAKSGRVGDAEKVFDEIPVKNIVCVNALLSAYSEGKLWMELLQLVKAIPKLKLVYDNFTLSISLRACAALSAVDLGKQVHGYALRSLCHMEADDVFLRSSLIEMYGKCGLVSTARDIFNLTGLKVAQNSRRDVVLWTSMIGVYGRNGCYQEVISSYNQMLIEGIKPDDIAFLTVISACSHTGQVQKGVQHFNSMSKEFSQEPQPEHYSCLVDLLCRAGELDKAWKLVSEMPKSGQENKCSVQLWVALLNACLEHGNLDLGTMAARKAIELDPQNVGLYVMLSNLYAKFGMWDEINKLRQSVKSMELGKDIGCSRIEVLSLYLDAA